MVETTLLLDLAEQQRFIVRHLTTALTQRGDRRRLEAEVDDLRTRVEAIEEHIGRR